VARDDAQWRRTALATSLAVLAASGACRSGRASELPAERDGRAHAERVQGVTLHTFEIGDPRARLLLVLHGGPGLDHTYMRPWLDALGDHARLRYVDLRGHGRSSPPPDGDGYTLSAAAADLAALVQLLQGGQPADIVAHDFGAAVAMQLAARHPERVRRMVLIAPLRDANQVRSIGARTRSNLGDGAWRRIQALTTPQGTLRDPRQSGELFRRLGRMWWFRPPSDAVLARMARDLTYRPEADEHFQLETTTFDGRTLAQDIRAPTLVLSGREDLTFPAVDSRALADILPHGRYAEVPAAGHCPFIEQNTTAIGEIQRFLAH